MYHNYSIAIDPARRLFNGAPSLLASWIDALLPGGRLVLPLTVAMPPGSPIGKGMAVVLTRREDDYAARLLTMVAIYNALGIRSAELEPLLMRALSGRDGAGITRLRRDPYEPSGECWLHAPGWCLSRV